MASYHHQKMAVGSPASPFAASSPSALSSSSSPTAAASTASSYLGWRRLPLRLRTPMRAAVALALVLYILGGLLSLPKFFHLLSLGPYDEDEGGSLLVPAAEYDVASMDALAGGGGGEDDDVRVSTELTLYEPPPRLHGPSGLPPKLSPDVAPSLTQWANFLMGGGLLEAHHFDLLARALVGFEARAAAQLTDPRRWMAGTPFNVTRYYRWRTNSPTSGLPPVQLGRFQPYVRRVLAPAGARLVVWGDLHGSAASLVRTLTHIASHERPCLVPNAQLRQNFTLADHCYFAFLGDYVDRGPDGLEVLYTLARLQVANPDRVFVVRGNHEDLSINYYVRKGWCAGGVG